MGLEGRRLRSNPHRLPLLVLLILPLIAAAEAQSPRYIESNSTRGGVDQRLSSTKRTGISNVSACKSLMVDSDANSDQYLNQVEYVDWLNDWLIHQTSLEAQLYSSFETLPLELQDLYDRYAFLYSDTDQIDIQGALPGTADDSASLDLLCQEASDIFSELDLPTKTTASTGAEPDTTATTIRELQGDVSVVDVLAIHGETTTLVELLDQAGLTDTLRGKGPFTVFAPTNDAFEALDLTRLEKADYQAHLVDLLAYHVSPELLLYSGFVENPGQQMLNGQTIDLTSVDPPTINLESSILVPDLLGDNGFVHFIDAVLLPPSYTMDAVTAAVVDPDLSILVELLTAADLVDTLQGEGPFTIFAPTNAAFEQTELLDSLMLGENKEMLANLLNQHVTTGIWRAENLQEGMPFLMANSHVAIINLDPSPMIDGSTVVKADRLVNNGVIHIIDTVLIPEDPTLSPSSTPSVAQTSSPSSTPTQVPTMSPSEETSPPTTMAPTSLAPTAIPSSTTAVPPTAVAKEESPSPTEASPVSEPPTPHADDQTFPPTIAPVLPGGDQQLEVTVVEVLAIHGETTTLVEKLDEAGLIDVLRGKGPFTVFAPNNDAFDAIDLSKLETEEYSSHFVDLLTYHIAPDLILASGLVLNGGPEMVNGQTIDITSLEPPVINLESSILVPDLLGENGIVHFIDSVLLPPSYRMDAVEAAMADPELSTFVELAIAANLLATLEGEGPFTIFAPTNAAFDQLGFGASNRDAQMDMLVDNLEQHVTNGIWVANKLQDGSILTMINEMDTTITTNPSLMIDDASIIDSDRLVHNGVIHIIDKVLGSAEPPTTPTAMPSKDTVPTGTQIPEEKECVIDVHNIYDTPSPPENPLTVLATDGLTTTFTVSQTWFSQSPAQRFATVYVLSPDGESRMCHQTSDAEYGVVDTFTAWCDEGTEVAYLLLLVEDERFEEDYGVPLPTECEDLNPLDEGNRVGISISIPCHCDPGELISNFEAGSIGWPTSIPTDYNGSAPTYAPTPVPSSAPTVGESSNDDFVTPEPTWDTVWELLQDDPDLSLFWSALELVNINNLLSTSDLDFTVFAPTNSDIQSVPALMSYSENIGSWTGHATKALQYHIIVADVSATSTALWNGQFGDTIVTLSGEALEVDASTQQVGGQVIVSPDWRARNGVVHILGGVLDPGWFQLSLMDVLEELSPLATVGRRLQSSRDFNIIIEWLGAINPGIRDELSVLEEEGTTLVAPRDNAFSKFEGVLDNDYILYHIMASNLYQDSGGEQLVPTRHPVADVWVTFDPNGLMRYNGVAVQSEWLAQNGVIHATESILKPPKMFEMLEVADAYTNYNTSTLLEFFLASGWDLDNLPGFLGVGEGQRLTLIAPMNNNFDQYLFTEDAKERLLTPLWSHHLEDMLLNLLADTAYTKSDIEELTGGWEGYHRLKMLGGQFSDLLSGGVINSGYLKNDTPSCVDGIIHFVDWMSLPPSVSGGIFDVLYAGNHSSNTFNFLSFLGDSEVYWDLAITSEVVTVLVPVDAAFDTATTMTKSEADQILRHHAFEEMLFTDTLLEMDGETFTSMGGSKWTVDVDEGAVFISNEDGLRVEIETDGNDLLMMNGVVHLIDRLMVSNTDSPQGPSPGFDSPATNPTIFPMYMPPVSEGTPAMSPTPSRPDMGASGPMQPPVAGELPTGGSSGSAGGDRPAQAGRPTGSTGGGPSAQTPTAVGSQSPSTLDQTNKSPPLLLETSFSVFNQKGLKASDLAKSENVAVLNNAFAEFMTVLASEVEGQQRKLQAAALVNHSRRLSVSLVPESAKIYGVSDTACSNGMPKDATCQQVYAHYELKVQDEEATAVESRYESAIQNAIVAGKLQGSVDAVTPNWTFKVVAIAESPEDKSGKMAWWVILFIVLACIFGCAGFCCIRAYFSARSKEETARRHMEEIEAPLLEGSVRLVNSECSKAASETSSARPPTDETDGPERSNRSDGSAFEDEANSQCVYPAAAMLDSYEDSPGRIARSMEKEDDFSEGGNESWGDDSDWEDGDEEVAEITKDDWSDEGWEEDDDSEGSFSPQRVDLASNDKAAEIDSFAGTEGISHDAVVHDAVSENDDASKDNGSKEEAGEAPINSQQVGSARAIEARRKLLERRRLQAEAAQSDPMPSTAVATEGEENAGDEPHYKSNNPNDSSDTIPVQSHQVGSARAIEARERFLERRRLRAAEGSPDAAAKPPATRQHEESPPGAADNQRSATENSTIAAVAAQADEVSVDSQQVGSARAIEARRKFLEPRRLAAAAAESVPENNSDSEVANEQPQTQSADVAPQQQREDELPRLAGTPSSGSVFHDAAALERSSSSESIFHEASETPLSDEFMADAGSVNSFGGNENVEESDSEISDADAEGHVSQLQSELAELDRQLSTDPRELERALAEASDDECNDEHDGHATKPKSEPRKPLSDPPTSADGAAGWSSIHDTLQTSSIYEAPGNGTG